MLRFLIVLSLFLSPKAMVQPAQAQPAEVVIKSTTNRAEENIGDYWIGEDFAAAFEKLGYSTAIDYRSEYQTERTPSAKMNIYMRGYTKFTPPFPAGQNVLYVYYPLSIQQNSAQKMPKEVLNARAPQPENANLDDDWQNFDILAVASSSYAATLRQNGINAIFVPQFTNPEKFYPAPDSTYQTDILFVGSNWHDRTSLRYALESGFNVSVYGYHWQNLVPKEMYKGEYIANTELNRYYSSAKIVLNDHRPDMKAFGFVNNRVYDATASGALVISDYMPEIEQAYGESVPMYKSKEELASLLNYYLSHEEERQALAATAREITLKKFTNTTAAQTLATHAHLPH